ncbi:MAG: hypothetical protein ACC656_12260 [Candidatus Heimdallarchaeota archaeon]
MYFQQTTEPTAYVSVGKNRLRVYNSRPTNKVFLNDSNEFEIELFNPKTTPILAKIQLNGEYISHGGIVLNPGERTFLERFLESNNKFKFSTYEVDSNNEAVKKAIRHNGKVRIEYYDEYKQQPFFPYWSSNINLTNTGDWTGNLGTFKTTTSSDYTSTPRIFYSSNSGDGGDQSYMNMSTSNANLDFMDAGNVAEMNTKIDLEETGRVAEGNASDQAFTYVDKQFNTFYFKCVEYIILPMSQKQKYEKSDIRIYCTGCGTRRRKGSWKFCPNCGCKL